LGAKKKNRGRKHQPAKQGGDRGVKGAKKTAQKIGINNTSTGMKVKSQRLPDSGKRKKKGGGGERAGAVAGRLSGRKKSKKRTPQFRGGKKIKKGTGSSCGRVLHKATTKAPVV